MRVNTSTAVAPLKIASATGSGAMWRAMTKTTEAMRASDAAFTPSSASDQCRESRSLAT